MSYSIFEYNRAWFYYTFENPDKVKPVHHALYFWALEHSNRLGWKEKFGFPTTLAMEVTGIKSYNTYIKTFKELVEFGFIILIQKSENQYQSNVIALSKNDTSRDKPLDKSVINHDSKQSSISGEISDSIITPLTNKPLDNTPEREFRPPSDNDVYRYMLEKKLENELANEESTKFVDYYNSKGWLVGTSDMKNWKSSVNGWIKKIEHFNFHKNKTNGKNQSRTQSDEQIIEQADGSEYLV